MPQPVRFVLVLHNHQPIGNFDEIFERAYQDSYRPLLEVFGRYDSLKISLHISGPLLEWLEANHPDYVDRVADLIAQGRIEVLGGAFHEPILSMVPSRDRVGQIRSFTQWLHQRFHIRVRGMWVPERVWEQSLTGDLVDAGIQYTVLDDFHFKNAGLTDAQLHAHYLTEDEGRVLAVFPGSERLRYLIPFGDPQKSIDYLAGVADQRAGAVVVFGDDGEKFGTWPDTHKHCYQDGWLERFFTAVVENQDWIHVTTLSEAFDSVRPAGKIYLPDSSYREMTEWALPADQQLEYERIAREMADDPHWPAIRRFVRGGFWRNFTVKYPESNDMYARMMSVSRRLDQLAQTGVAAELIERARTELYRGQCNCGYWHGAFGGIYLPHLRNAVYRHLIAADNLLDEAAGRPENWIDDSHGDFNFDTRQEVRLENDKLIAFLAPGRGGHLYELDLRSIQHNLLAAFTRRPEAYHRKVLAGASSDNGQCSSIHERVIFKQKGLEKRVQYDDYPRKAMVDLFYDDNATLEAVASGQAAQRGDFVDGVYDCRVQRNPHRIRVLMTREGNVWREPLLITKALTLDVGSSTLEIAYQLDRLPKYQQLHFAVEFNFAGMPAGLDGRYFYDADRNRLGQLDTRLDLTDVQGLGLVDEWLGLDVALKTSRPANIWTFPIETVSQSEAGFELICQSVAVQPHWIIVPDADGRWQVTIHLVLDTALAGNPAENQVAAATT